MWFMNPACLVNICRSHSKKSSELTEQLLNEDVEIISKKKKHGSTPKGFKVLFVGAEKKKYSVPKGCKLLFVGAEEKKYSVPLKYLLHPKLQELLEKYQGPVFDPKWNEPIVLDQCSIETFDQVLNNIKNINKNLIFS